MEEVQEPHSAPAPSSDRRDDNTVYVGKKDVMSYVLAVVTQFNQGSNQVKVKARGNVISRAVDVSQIVKNRFLSSLKITGFDVTTEELQSEDGSMRKVSSLTLTLEK
ncbi:MAG: DNA-binding protein Alba [Candidatus Micrarchaeota archaeon]